MSRQPRKTRAFTLNELLITIAILGVLSVIAVPNVQDSLIRARIASVQNDLRVVADGIEAFAIDQGHYPYGSDEPALQFMTNYDAQKALAGLLGSYLPNTPELLCDPFTQSVVAAINESVALEEDILPDLFGFGYYDYAHFMVPPRPPKPAYGIVSFGPDGNDSSLGLRPLPGVGSLIRGAEYQPSNGLLSGGDLGRFGGSLSYSQHIP